MHYNDKINEIHPCKLMACLMISNSFVNKLINSQGFTFFSAYIIPEPKSFLDKVFIRNVTGIVTLFTDTLKNAIDNHVKPMTAKLLQSLCCGLPFIPLATGI